MASGDKSTSRLGENLLVVEDTSGLRARGVYVLGADGEIADTGASAIALGGGSTAGSLDGASVTGSNQVLVTGTTATKAVYVSNDTDAEVEFYYDTELLVRLGPKENAILPVDIGTADLEVKHTGTLPTTGANVSGTLIR